MSCPRSTSFRSLLESQSWDVAGPELSPSPGKKSVPLLGANRQWAAVAPPPPFPRTQHLSPLWKWRGKFAEVGAHPLGTTWRAAHLISYTSWVLVSGTLPFWKLEICSSVVQVTFTDSPQTRSRETEDVLPSLGSVSCVPGPEGLRPFSFPTACAPVPPRAKLCPRGWAGGSD